MMMTMIMMKMIKTLTGGLTDHFNKLTMDFQLQGCY